MRCERTLRGGVALSSVKSRTVWYFHGFDPASTARYRRIFASAVSRFDASLGDLPDGGDGWQVVRSDTQGEVRTAIRYARYEDLVRSYRVLPLWRRILRGFAAVVGLIRSGTLRRLRTPGRRQAVLALSPAGVLVLPVLLCLAPLLLAPVVGLVMFAVLMTAAIILLRASLLDVVFDLFSYMRMMANGQGTDREAYHERIAQFAADVLAEPGDPEGEILLVGHSLGGVAAILTMARLLEDWPPGQRIHLLTLGSVHGVVLAHAGAGRDHLAEAIARIASDARVTWLDVTSPHDAFCLPLTDPLLQIGPLAKPGMKSPRVISAPLRNAPSIPGDRRTAFPAMRRHMGYLLPPQTRGGFDYTDVVTGEIPLDTRCAEIANSPKARMWQS